MIRRLLLVAVLSTAAVNARAGRPLTTDDASILDPGRCQVESWIDRSDGAATGWFVPACNLGLGTELQAGFARSRVDGQARFAEAYVQAKTLIREMTEREPWGVGLVLGVARKPRNETHRGWDNPYALVPFTQAICASPLTFHANVGWSRDRETRRDHTLWGVALEAAAGERITFVAEAFGQDSEKPFVRIGGRWTAIPRILDVDLTWVRRPGGTSEERYLSLGVTWVTGALMP